MAPEAHTTLETGFSAPHTGHTTTSNQIRAAPRSRLGDLSNSIHPVFRRGNFASSFKYDALQECLRLAGRLITKPAPLSVWHTILFSPAYTTDFAIYPIGAKHYQFASVFSSLNDAQVRATEAKLIEFADKIHFKLVAGPGEEECPHTQIDDGRTTATVSLSATALAGLDDASSIPRDERLVKSFNFAVALVHELAHSVCELTRPQGHYYFPQSAVAEVGYAAESQIFGGIVDTRTVLPDDSSAYVEHRARLKPWPLLPIVALYIHNTETIGVRLKGSREIFVPQKTGKEGAVFAKLDFNFVQKLFSEAFWTKEMVEKGPRALQPEFDAQDWIPFPLPLLEERYRTLARVFREAEDDLDDRYDGSSVREQSRLNGALAEWEDFADRWAPGK